ncbi:MAG TPA: DNA methyltransferase [Candidatus Dormibacteraeota bacterium]|nr:DNA methyltransferase [Candidatus Dormibacteraeota bacterium]
MNRRTEPQVRVMKLAALAPAPYNPRTIPDEAARGLRASIRRFGLVQPIVFNSRSGHVVGGHQRIKALAELGKTEAQVVVVDLPEFEEKALNVTLNNPAITGEFTDGLQAILAELAANPQIEFEELQLDALLDTSLDGIIEDEVPEPSKKPVTRTGDLWILGDNRLLCGDSTNADDVRRVLADATPRLLLTDPPYGVELDMEWRDRAGLNSLGLAEHSYMRKEGHRNTRISGDTKADWSDAFALVPSLDTAYVWHASAFSIEVGAGLRRIGFDLKQQIIWRKPHFALSRQHYHWQHEPCWYARKRRALPFRGSRDQSTIWDAASPKMLMTGSTEEKVDHPTQKPVALYVRPIKNHLKPGECFYEAFCGSGTAIVAAEQTRARCHAIELDPTFADIAVSRWQNFTGGKATRARH